MKLRTLLILDTALAVIFALGLLLGPETVLKFFGLTMGKTELVLARIIGAALLAFAALAWMGRETADPQAAQATLITLLIFSAIGFVVSLLGILGGVTRSGWAWLVVVVFLASAAGSAYYQFAGPRQ